MTSDKFGHRRPYDIGYYDVEFFKGETGVKGRNRMLDSGVYFGHAQALTAMFPDHEKLNILAVADGIGHASKHLVHLGWDWVTYSDVSEWAVEHNAMKACGCLRCQFHTSAWVADVRDLGWLPARSYDVVFCINLLGYLDRADVPRALEQLLSCCYGRLAIQVAHLDEVHAATRDAQGRIHMESDAFWADQFARLGLVEDEEALARAREAGHEWPHCLKRIV